MRGKMAIDDAVERVSAREFQNRPGHYQDRALRGPLYITSHGRDRLALISVEEYERLRKRDRQALLVEELSEKTIDAIAVAKVPPGHDHLDAELDS
jgi:prevent-host-death family protein